MLQYYPNRRDVVTFVSVRFGCRLRRECTRTLWAVTHRFGRRGSHFRTDHEELETRQGAPHSVTPIIDKLPRRREAE